MSYNMLDMELDYENQIKYLESEVKRLKIKCRFEEQEKIVPNLYRPIMIPSQN